MCSRALQIMEISDVRRPIVRRIAAQSFLENGSDCGSFPIGKNSS